MRTLVLPFLIATWAAAPLLAADTPQRADPRPRVIVLTDLSNEPDDEESLVRFLVYANEFDVEGLIATTSTHLRKGPREDLIRRDLDAYEKVLPNLRKHAPGYPSADHLRSVTKTGQTEYGMDAVGTGKSTAGSNHIIQVVDRADDRPIWVTVWGGANTLAQALWDVKATRDQAAVDRFTSKLRVYTISDQDNSGHWMRPEFPKLFYIVSPGNVGQEYWRATWNGISGDRLNKIGVMHRFEMVDNPWLEQHIIKDHGPLGALYPRIGFIMEGDTPSFLGLINNGLGWHVRPDYGGWGGRYKEYQPWGEKRPIWTETRDSRDTVTSDDNGRTETSHHATIWRWREHFQNDFAARMDWCVADDYKKANHNPIAVLNSDRTRNVLAIPARPGETIRLSADGTTDPDGNAVETRWWIYEEAGTLWDPKTRRFPAGVRLSADQGLTTSLTAPRVEKPETIHIILEVRDNGSPKLWAYRRAVVTIIPTPDISSSKPTLFIVGDSTVKTGTKGQMGWGDPVAGFFDKSRIKVENHAIGGRSSRTFQTEGRWDRILAAAKPGDFVLIQMGHNDGGPLDDARRARGSIRGIGDESREIDNPITKKKEVVHTYGWYLRKYIAEARARGMKPVLVAPIPHCPKQPVQKGAVEKNPYVGWAEEVARAEKVPFIHLNRLVLAHYAELTPAEIKARYFTPADDTHTSPAGAERNAAAVVEGVRALQDCSLKDYLLKR